MADLKPRKPRIRKTAPTVRERAAAAQAEADKPEKPKRNRRFAAKLLRPLAKVLRKLRPGKRLHLPDNRFGKVLRFIGRMLNHLVPRYFANSWREVRQVTWTSRRETWRLTGAVFIFAIVFGAMVYGVDKGLDEIFKKFVLK